MSRGTERKRALQKSLRALCPLISYDDAQAVLKTAGAGHLRHLPPSVAVWLATTSHIRHAHTDYDALLADGYDRDAARFFVLDAVNDCLTRWGSTRPLEAEDDTADLPDQV